MEPFQSLTGEYECCLIFANNERLETIKAQYSEEEIANATKMCKRDYPLIRYPVLITAIQYRNQPEFNYLLDLFVKYGGDVNTIYYDQQGYWTSIFGELSNFYPRNMLESNHCVGISKLVQYGFDVNQTLKERNVTPLYYAMSTCRWTLAQELIDNGAVLQPVGPREEYFFLAPENIQTCPEPQKSLLLQVFQKTFYPDQELEKEKAEKLFNEWSAQMKALCYS